MNEDAEDYVNYILGLIKSIADVHELDKLHLRNQFNKDSDIEIEFFPGWVISEYFLTFLQMQKLWRKLTSKQT